MKNTKALFLVKQRKDGLFECRTVGFETFNDIESFLTTST